MTHYQFIVEYYSSRLVRILFKKGPSRLFRPKTTSLSSIGSYLQEVTGSSNPMSQRQISRLSQYLQESREALIDLVNDIWVVTPVDKEKALERFPNRQLFASWIAATYLLDKVLR